MLGLKLLRSRLPIRCLKYYSSAAEAAAGISLNQGASSSLPSDERIISPKVSSLVDQIANLTVLEVSDLNYALKKKLNIADQPIFAAPVAASSVAGNAPVEEEESQPAQKSVFAVKLVKFDDSKKIALIKEIRNAIEGLNLVQAKKFVETAPVEVKGDLGKNEAEALKTALEKVGASCEIV
ncbi:unnamed protein product [Bursaphelenchus okinawaensis]|uniref:Ribosomal_L12 domain-containing protein n=1 Tax=Bursaphelenchus okinawaensis TaxID=465554 RepID=A0A811LLR4_9BILA|nr:unnamed protein product [Bursaphelenchus okinawaensis]CAG9126010.1 unnamed protein product [Bursaphelenchus okinawaensis]